jgi:hypothetical protein
MIHYYDRCSLKKEEGRVDWSVVAKHQIIRILILVVLVPVSLASILIFLRLPLRPYGAYFYLLYLSIVFVYLSLSDYRKDRRVRSQLDYRGVQGEDGRILQEAPDCSAPSWVFGNLT